MATYKIKRSKKEIEDQNKSDNRKIGAALVGGGAAAGAYDVMEGEGRLSGRATRFHNAKSDRVKQILKEGLDGRKTLDPNSYTNQILKGAATKDGRPLVYTTKSRLVASDVGRSRMNNGFAKDAGKTLKVKIPYELEKKIRVTDNPELLGMSKKEWTKHMKGKAFLADEAQLNLIYNDLDATNKGKTRIYNGSISSKYIKGSKNYKGQSLKEWGKYVKNNPGRFAKGAAIAGIPIALGAGLIYKNRKKKDDERKKIREEIYKEQNPKETKKRKNFSLFGDIIRGAARGISEEMENKSGNAPKFGKGDEDTVFGTITLSMINKRRFLGKKSKFEIRNDLRIDGYLENSIMDYWITEEFDKIPESCPDKWKKFTVVGVPEENKTMDATIITNQGKMLKGKVMIEASKW